MNDNYIMFIFHTLVDIDDAFKEYTIWNLYVGRGNVV
jgi:hypothetical protein